jgi:hypothetical protein
MEIDEKLSYSLYVILSSVSLRPPSAFSVHCLLQFVDLSLSPFIPASFPIPSSFSDPSRKAANGPPPCLFRSSLRRRPAKCGA